MTISLRQKQSEFALMVARLINKASEMGFEVTLGEAYRTPEQAAVYAKMGVGSRNSFHCQRLAIDINLFKDGLFLNDTAAHEPLGTWWESIGGTWGGRFKRKDGNHYSYGE